LSFEELYEMYAKDIYRFSFWLTRDSDEAKDITSETFIKAWGNFSGIRTETIKGYLLTIARNIYIDHKRKSKRLVGLEIISKKLTCGPDKDLEIINELERINTMLNNFPEIDRTVFLLRVQQELNYEEIARILKISISAAKVKVHRVRKKIIEKTISKEV
jgi:RNA polymerase sigma-70 factor (ECF subfamily)